MTLALSLFVLFYILMLAVQQYRPWVALGGAGAFLLLGKLGVGYRMIEEDAKPLESAEETK